MIPAMSDPAAVPADAPLVEVDKPALERLLFDPDVVVINALPMAAFEAGHIPGTHSLPVADIEERAPHELPDRARPIVVYCASSTCGADRRAIAALRALGYTNLRAYTPGFAGWVESGGAVELGRGTPIPPAHGHATEPVADVHVTPITLRPIGAGSTGAPGRRAASGLPGAGHRADRWSDALDRVVGLPAQALIGLWLGIILAFGLLYWVPAVFGRVTLTAAGEPVPGTLHGLWTALYFSFVTGLSVGYGDVVPVGLARVPAIFEGAADLLLFGFVVSKFVSRRQDQLLEQLHHTAFEERLGRVRTNLHLVLSEFDAIAEDARQAPDPAVAGRVLVRAESAALVFAGELRTIHELLYQPAETLEEGVLEGILASLAANLEALRELLASLPAWGLQSPVLRHHVRRTTELAEEICGDCVPRAVTSGMRVWMDRVRSLARDLPGTALAEPPAAG